ncbi:PaaI family thioesterase [Metabacillus sp. RGM 3146]|uniref:PaaI family thioesterase n=1 Tax=Metabacillus sp. RGM 3146 TaxID=3401092 RepID=UPI003B9C8FF1
MNKEELLAQFQQIIETSNEEELHVAKLLADGMEKKQKKQNGTYIGALMHVQNEWNANGDLTMKIPNTPIIQNNLNIVHGGITATLLDSAMGTFAGSLLSEGKSAVTSEMKINYVAPGTGSFLTCNAALIHKGKRTIVLQGQVFRDDGELIAHSTATFYIIDK